MEEKLYNDAIKTKLWKKVLSAFLAVIIGFGTVVTLIVGSSKLQDWLGIKSMLSAYAAEIVDTDGAVAVNEEAMLEDNSLIDIEYEDGTNTAYLFSEPISYTDENGNLKTKDISVEKQSDKELKEQGYDYTNGQNDYRINFSKDSTVGLKIEFGESSYSIIPKSDNKVLGRKSVSSILDEQFEDFEYNNIYGEGTNLKFYPQLNGVKDEIILNNNINKNIFEFVIETDNCTATLNDDGTVSLISNSDNTIVQMFSAPFAYDSEYVEGVYDEHYSNCNYTLEEKGNGVYILAIVVDSDWLNSSDIKYPVVIDPTTSHILNMYDLPIHSTRKTTGATVDANAVGTSSEYGTSRSLVKFMKPSEIQKYATINSAYYWTRELTGRTSSFNCGIYQITGSWNEKSLWSTAPSYNGTKITYRNINSNSSDYEPSPYWYKFDIRSLVQKWYTGTTNYGFMMKYMNEGNSAKNLRTFAHAEYSVSAWRPYTVINYTNDKTAPTATITKSTSSWTNGNVTVTISNAKDANSNCGLNSTPYSFSTKSGSYSWGTATSKSYSSNGTFYVAVRDKANNVREYPITINNIDKTAPSKPNVTGNPTDWTNSSVTLTANSSDGASGLSQFSFSTSQGVYSWQSENTKTFSENTTVYVYAKDKVGNISQPQIVVVDKIDNTAPSSPVLTGNYDEWSNGDVEITAESTDDLSGINAYSFSTEPDEYKWQEENTAVISESSKVYVCSKDNAGNISLQTEVDLKIDKISPSGSIDVDLPTDWVKNVKVTANANDEISGLHSVPYSFSTVEDEYNWQESNETTISHNGTVYVYARDAAENIVLLDTVVVDKIDDQAPIIEDVQIEDNGDETIITVIASDTQSGIKEYCISGENNWQTSNVFKIEKDSLNYLTVGVRDNVDNYASKKCDIYTPQIYYENGRIGIYNPNPKFQSDIYYKFDESPLGWQKYDEPIVLPDDKEDIYVAFESNSLFLIFANIDKLQIESQIPCQNDFSYSEQNIDLSLGYNGTSFDVERQYKNDEWHYSFESSLVIVDNGAIKVNFPDFSSLMYIYQNKYSYINYNYDSSISVIYDEDDTSIIEYVVTKDNINYHYDLSGKLIKISNKYGDLFHFIRSNSKIIIKDSAQRETILNYSDDHLVSIVDSKGGIINYSYDDENNLIKVTDQANVVIGKYSYDDNNILISSNQNNIIRDSQNRVSEIVHNNGYYTRYTYDDNNVTISSADGKVTSYEFDYFGKIRSYVDENEDVITYNYDIDNRVIKVLKEDVVLEEYQYNENNKLTYKSDSSGGISYYYDDMGNVIKTFEYFKDDPSKNKVTFYVYDSNQNVKIQAIRYRETDVFSTTYYPDSSDDEVFEFEYENGILTKKTDVNNDITVFYDYDNYGNNIKTTTKTVENDKVSLSINENVYDVLNRIVSSKNEENEIIYTYDAAGRTLLVNTDGSFRRTVYDNYGRVVQEISDSEYNPELDNLPNAYSDTDIGQRYVYDEFGNLIKEINNYDIETTYEYSDVGTLSKKHFDIYDYYYLPNGNCDKIDVSGQTVIDYDYKVSDSDISTSDGEYINRIEYANGYEEEQKVNKYGNIQAKYIDGLSFYSFGYFNEKMSYYENEIVRRTEISSENNQSIYKKYSGYFNDLFSYTVTTDEDTQTIEEEHFDEKQYTTVIGENSASYTTPSSAFTYNADSNEDTATVSIVNAETTLLSSNINYNEDDNILTKSYGTDIASFEIHYDDNGNIASDENNQYQYDSLGQLKATAGNINSSYTYDDRGNMLTKTVNGVTTSFAYTNTQWQDQLTSVNGGVLNYDANGNLVSYDGKTYTWSHGKWLESVIDGENTYSYGYDSNGIRASKTVNGVETSYNTLNGKMLAQYDDINEIYFQYSNDTPIGFVLNDTQYFYITNLSGDIVGITDSNGELIAEYSYDEWGKLLGITTAQENNAEQLAVAEINPLRYRGYYYDNETGMYYLQSRYYDPELCRFISADGFEYLTTEGKLNLNAYVYCWNCPVIFDDIEGTTPQLSINLSDIIAFIKSINNEIKSEFDEIKDKYTKLFNNWKKSLITHYNSFIDKLEYFINYPDAVINSALSKLFNTEINIRFGLVEFIRDKLGVSISLSSLKYQENNNGSRMARSASKSSSSTTTEDNNIVMALIQGIIAGIELDWLNDILEIFGSGLEDLAKKSFEAVKQLSLLFITTLNTTFSYFTDAFNCMLTFDSFILDKGEKIALETGGLINAKGIAKGFGGFVSIFSFFLKVDSAGTGAFTKSEDIIMSVVTLVIDIASLFLGPVAGVLVPMISSLVIDITALRIKGLIFKY